MFTYTCLLLHFNTFFNILGNSYYVFNGNHLIENSPRSIMDYGFPHFVNRVDAVMIHGLPPTTYLFRYMIKYKIGLVKFVTVKCAVLYSITEQPYKTYEGQTI